MNTGIIIGGFFFVLYLITLLTKVKNEKSPLFNKKVVKVVFLIIAVVLYSLLVAIVSGSRDFQVFKSYLSFLLFYLPGGFAIIHVFKKYFSIVEIFKVIIVVTVIQSLIILSMLFNSEFKETLFSLMRDGSIRAEKNLSSGGFRFLGFAYGTTWDLSIVQSIGTMCLLLLFKINKASVNIKNTLFLLLISISIFLTGRTGFFGLAFGLLLLIIPLNKSEMPLAKIFKLSFKILVIVLPFFFLLLSLIPTDVLDTINKNVLPWAFEMFQSDTGAQFETASSNELKEMYFTPSLKTFLIGDGHYINPYDNDRYYMDTDAGYMRHILFYGLFGCILMGAVYITTFYQMFHFTNIFNRASAVKIYVIFLGFYFFISHIKGDILLGADMPIKMLFLQYAMFILFRSEGDCEKADSV
jgi:hypothetical protein